MAGPQRRGPAWAAAVAACASIWLMAGNAFAQAPPGRVKAQACIACHGPLGIATLPGAPNLAGQPEVYLAEQLKAYRNGKRVNEMMSLVAKPLSDEDIALLAAWFASISIEVREKP